MDPDDLISKDYFENMINSIKSYKTSICMAERICLIRDIVPGIHAYKSFLPGNDLSLVQNRQAVYGKNNVASHAVGTFTFLLGIVWCKLFKADVFGGIRFDESLRLMEDIEIWGRLLSRVDSFSVSSGSVYYYRVRKGSLSRCYFMPEAFNDVEKAYQSVVGYFQNEFPEIDQTLIASSLHTAKITMWLDNLAITKEAQRAGKFRGSLLHQLLYGDK